MLAEAAGAIPVALTKWRYMAQNKTLPKLRELMIQGKLDALSDFSEACRMELGRSARRVPGPILPPSRPE